MKVVWQQYGGALVAALAGVLLLGILAGVGRMCGIPLLVEGFAPMETVYGVSLEEQETSMLNEVNKMHEITGNYSDAIEVGHKTAVQEHLTLSGAYGEAVEVRLCKIYKDGQSIDWETDENGVEYFCFEEPGIYTVFFQFRDSTGSVEYAQVRIPVQRSVA